MSLALLNKLNGGRKSHLYNWLLKRPHEPRICWYPSCWGDFRDLLYLHKSNLGRSYPGMPEPRTSSSTPTAPSAASRDSTTFPLIGTQFSETSGRSSPFWPKRSCHGWRSAGMPARVV
jgi:hypothetical protein